MPWSDLMNNCSHAACCSCTAPSFTPPANPLIFKVRAGTEWEEADVKSNLLQSFGSNAQSVKISGTGQLHSATSLNNASGASVRPLGFAPCAPLLLSPWRPPDDTSALGNKVRNGGKELNAGKVPCGEHVRWKQGETSAVLRRSLRQRHLTVGRYPCSSPPVWGPRRATTACLAGRGVACARP